MLKNYWKTAMRFLLKNKLFSFINIVGLAMGTLCCLYILLYVKQQYSNDRYEDQASDIYRVITMMKLSGDRHRMATSSPPIAGAMKREFPEVMQYTRAFNATIFGADEHLFRYKDKSFFEKDVLFVDSTFFDLFTYRFLRGDPGKALQEPYSVVLLKATADKLFGREDPMGKTIVIDNKAGKENLKVTGIVEAPGPSHIQAKVFITMNSGLIGNIIRSIDHWAGSNMIYAYVKLRPGADPRELERKLPVFLTRHGGQEMRALGIEKQLELQPIAAIHTTPDLEVEVSQTVSASFLSILSLIALLIQVIACINFMNLSTARASKRAKEIGVRKVMGAGQGNLMGQFLGESLLLALMGIILALPLLWILLPSLNQLTRADISLAAFRDYRIWLILLGLVAGTGLLSGSYPAFYLAAFQAIRVLKGNFTNRLSAAGLRRWLVVLQFSLSIILITGIVVIYTQLEYIKNKNLGFDAAQKVIFNIYTGNVDRGRLMADLRLLPGVKTVTASNSQLGKKIMQDQKVYLAGGNMANGPDVEMMDADKYFIRTAGIRLVAGRDFRDFDSGRVLINETLASRLRLDPAKAVGTNLYSQWGDRTAVTYRIAGVMKDFHFDNLHETVKPFMLVYDPDGPALCTLMASCNSNNYKSLLSGMAAVWQKDVTGVPFEFAFLDEEVQKEYESESTLMKIIDSFTAMAILISCLGLFGLAAFSAEQRSREIGVRKVLGASVAGIVGLLSSGFLRLVGLALLIATPVSWWVMQQWLAGFAYRIEIRWWMFALSGLLAAGVAMVTVSWHTIMAARANPVRSLRAD